MLRKLLLFLALAGSAFSQGITTSTARRVVTGSSLPATCAVGDIFFKTTATIGTYQCTSTNTWVAMGGGGGSAAWGAITGTLSDQTDLAAALAAKLPLAGGTMAGSLLFTDASFDIGASGATRPRDIFLSRDATVGRNLTVGTSILANGATGAIELTHTDTFTHYAVQAITFGYTTISSPTTVPLVDDDYSSSIPLPFTFSFYGTGKTALLICANAYITFNTSDTGCSEGGSTIPVVGPTDFIAGYWHDLVPSLGGTVTYGTEGTTPNRIFIVQFTDIQSYNHNMGGFPASFQIKLFETSNLVEVHTLSAQSAGDTVVQGVENAAGDLASTPTGRNNVDFNLTNDAQRFTYVPASSVGGDILWLVSGSPVLGINRTASSNRVEINNGTLIKDGGSLAGLDASDLTLGVPGSSTVFESATTNSLVFNADKTSAIFARLKSAIPPSVSGSTGTHGGDFLLNPANGGPSTNTTSPTGGRGGNENLDTGDGADATTGTVSNTGGQGGSISSQGGSGGSASHADASNTGGQSGGFTFSTIGAGSASGSGTASNTGGAAGDIGLFTGQGGAASGGDTAAGGRGGNIGLSSGNGANATGAATSSTAGAGGSVSITAGIGGSAADATTNNGGNGGDIVLTPGTAGTGSTANGVDGTIQFVGLAKFAGTNTTAAVAGVIGVTCPAITCTAAYTWIKAVAADGSIVYFPAWK